jgi:cytochrome c oxidase subunit 2
MSMVNDMMNTIPTGTLLADASKWPLFDMWFMNKSASTYGGSSDVTFMFIVYLSIFWFVLLMGLMVYFAFKYRRRQGQPAPVSPSHNTRIEIAWTVGPSLLLVILFVMGFKGYSDMLVPKGGGLDVDLIGQKWSWTINYPTGASSTHSTPANLLSSKPVPVYFIPEQTPIRMKMISKDVMHSFWVPDFRSKIDVLPNRYTKYWFETEKIPADAPKLQESGAWAFLDGTPHVDHWVFCTEYCGEFHSEMAAIFRVIPKAKFDEWVAKSDAAEHPAARGKKLWERNCISCHSIDGSRGTGPTWKNMYGAMHAMSGGKQVKVDDDYIRESIWYPQAKTVAGFEGVAMTSYLGVLDDKAINAIIAFMKSEHVAENWKELGGVSKDFKPAEGASAEGAPADKPADPAATPAPAPEAKK